MSPPTPPNDPTTPPPSPSSPGPPPPAIPAAEQQVVPPDVLRQIGPLAQAAAVQLQFSPAQDPILKHLTSDLLGQALAARSKEQDQAFELKKLELGNQAEARKIDSNGDLHSKFFMTGMLVIALVFIFALCWLFLGYGKAELTEKIVTLVVGLAGGGLAGFGLGRYSASKKETNGK